MRSGGSRKPADILSACDELLHGVRELLLAEQREMLGRKAGISEIFSERDYPEMGNDFRHAIRSCALRDDLSMNRSILGVYDEISVRLAKAFRGEGFTGFNGLSEYEEDLRAYGFPDLSRAMLSGDHDAISAACAAFDGRLRAFLTERSIGLGVYESLEELKASLELPSTRRG
jgi:hypothetical protein